jgi:site-specific DNA-methyltransferase (adenine-specific)
MMKLHNENCWLNVCKMADKSVDCIITDPPYDEPLDIEQLKRVCAGNIIVFCNPLYRFFQPDEIAYWVKTPSTKNYSRGLGHFVEEILILRGPIFNPLHWSQMTGVYDDRLVYKPTHPYEKPLSLVERLVRIYSFHHDIVMDPFMGSGTTGVACKNLGRNFIGYESDQDYFNLAKNRIEIGD